MAAIHAPWGRSTIGTTHVLSRRLALACATAAVAELGYLMGRVVSDVKRIEAGRRD